MGYGLEHIHLPYLSWGLESKATNSRESFLIKTANQSIHFKRASDGLSFLAKKFAQENNRPALFCIPEFICREVSDAIKMSDANMVFFKINQNLGVDFEDLQKKLNDNNCDYLLVVNYFGQPFDIQFIKKIIGDKKTLIIEDNAHGFLGRDKNGEWLGLRADFGLFSPRKTFPIPFGGMLYSKHKLSFHDEKYPVLTIGIWPKINFLIKLVLKYMMATFFIKKYASLFRKNNLISVRDDQSSIEFFNWIPWTKLWSFDQEIKRRRQVHQKIQKMAAELNIFSLNNSLGPYEVPYGFAFLNKNIEDVKNIKKIFIKNDMEIFVWPELPDEIEVSSDHHYKNIYVLRYLW